MAEYNILYWQDIPSLVEAKDDGGTKKRQLSQRFQDLIDLAAMRRGLAGTDEYLMEWKRGRPETREGSAEEVVNAVAEEIEAKFEEIKTAAVPKQ